MQNEIRMLTVITSIQLCTQQHNSTKGKKKKKSLKGTRIGKKKIELLYSQLTYLTAYKENTKKKKSTDELLRTHIHQNG